MSTPVDRVGLTVRPVTSGFPSEADIIRAARHVSNVPGAVIQGSRERELACRGFETFQRVRLSIRTKPDLAVHPATPITDGQQSMHRDPGVTLKPARVGLEQAA